jgi:RNA polymerase sigma-70 factor (ECF subfamily)
MLVERYQDRVTTNCRHLSGSDSDAPDLAQEVFVKAYYGLSRFEGRAKFSTWLQRIKVNHCLNFLKKRRGKTFVEVDQSQERVPEAMRVQPVAERRLEVEDHRDTIRRVLDEMTETLRVPVILRDMDGLAYEEIAERLGIGLSAVKMRIKRGREEFRRLYGIMARPPATTTVGREAVGETR